MSDIDQPYEGPPAEPVPDPEADLRGVDEDEALHTDQLLPDPEDDAWEPPDRPSTPTAEGYTVTDSGDTLEDRLRQEEPEPDPYAERDPSTEV